MRTIAALLPLGLFACGGKSSPAVDGTYTLCQEVLEHSGETLELKGGRFRYWFYSDVATTNAASYPLTGSYTLTGDVLTFDHSRVDSRTIELVNGVPVLWRKDGLDHWKKNGRIRPYDVLIRVEGVSGDPDFEHRPAIDRIKSAEVRERDLKAREERWAGMGPGCRALTEARTFDGDPNGDGYRQALFRARENMSPNFLGDLIGKMHADSPVSLECKRTLQDLFGAGPLRLPSDPPPLKGAQLKKALEGLTEALSMAKDRSALEDTLILFLRVSAVWKIDLAVPETGHRIWLVASSNGFESDSKTPADDDYKWTRSMPKLIPACQKWMREQLAK